MRPLFPTTETINNEKAFTLIELLIVIAVVAILMVTIAIVINPGEPLVGAEDTTLTYLEKRYEGETKAGEERHGICFIR